MTEIWPFLATFIFLFIIGLYIRQHYQYSHSKLAPFLLIIIIYAVISKVLVQIPANFMTGLFDSYIASDNLLYLEVYIAFLIAFNISAALGLGLSLWGLTEWNYGFWNTDSITKLPYHIIDFIIFYILGLIIFCLPLALITWLTPWYIWFVPYLPYILAIAAAQFLGIIFNAFFGGLQYTVNGLWTTSVKYGDGDWRVTDSYPGTKDYYDPTLVYLCYIASYIILWYFLERWDILIGLTLVYIIYGIFTRGYLEDKFPL